MLFLLALNVVGVLLRRNVSNHVSPAVVGYTNVALTDGAEHMVLTFPRGDNTTELCRILLQEHLKIFFSLFAECHG